MIQTFTIIEGKIAPMMDMNIDTDVIMPKQFLKGIDRSNLDRGLFYDLRVLPSGALNPQFVLNQLDWHNSQFLVVGPNFGCGSSREHAVWGLLQSGIRALIGTTFAGIFSDNCQRNGILLIKLTPEDVALVEKVALSPPNNHITVNLIEQKIFLPEAQIIRFDLDARNKEALIKGWDAIGMTLEHQANILKFEREYMARHPWLS